MITVTNITISLSLSLPPLLLIIIITALNARQYSRGLQLVDTIASDSSKPYYKQLARHYEDSRQYDLAERCYVSADQPQLAVEMHTKLGHWEIAHKLAMSYMSEGEVGLLVRHTLLSVFSLLSLCYLSSLFLYVSYDYTNTTILSHHHLPWHPHLPHNTPIPSLYL